MFSDKHNQKPFLSVSTAMLRILLYHMWTEGYPDVCSLVNGKLTDQETEDIDGIIPESIYNEIFFECITRSKDPFFGLKFGSVLSLQRTGVLGYLMMNSSTFGSSLNAYIRFQATFNESVKIYLQQNSETARISYEIFGDERTARHRLEFHFSALKSNFFELTSFELIFSKIVFNYQPESSTYEYKKYLGIVPQYGDENFVEFPAKFLNFTILNSNQQLIPIFEENLNEKMKISGGNSFARKVKQELHRRIGKKLPRSISELGKHFGVSERQFQVRLESENTTFRKLHDEVQSEFATTYLKNGSPIAEIAYVLGFSEVSAFQRAYKRWTGVTPAQIRK